MIKNDILDNLLKRALGYTQEETTVEYSVEEDGSKRATKERKSEKVYPPDMQALKLYLELREEDDLTALTDEELEREKNRLMCELYAISKGEGDC